jgi:Protein of unknown function (DUF3606)
MVEPIMPLTQSLAPDRSHIAKTDIKRWAKHFSVTHDVLEAAIAKVGTSVDAVQQELMRGKLRAEKRESASGGASRGRKRTRPMEMQSDDRAQAAVPMATTSLNKPDNAGPTISRGQAEARRKSSLKKQRAAQKEIVDF